MTVLLSAIELSRLIYRAGGVSLLAVHWEKKEGGGYQRYQSEHIPTAQFCDPAIRLSGVPGSQLGRNPLPSAEQVQEAVDQWGLRDNYPIVVYDESRGLFAARAWWTLRWAGINNVRILDGGLKAWEKIERPIVGGPGNLAVEGNITVRTQQLPTATIEQVKDHSGILLDARDARRFAGIREVLDLKAGHIPGAVNLPTTEVLNDDYTIRSVDEVREAFANVGVTSAENVIVYSGSGNHSAQLIAAMEYAGLGIPTHYVGGWSQWSGDPQNPVEHGH